MRSKLYAAISIPLFAILYLDTVVVVLTLLIFAWLHWKGPIRVLSQLWAKSVFLIIGKKIHLRGKENINKSDKYILVANHSSLFDIMAIMSFYPGVSWFGHERLLKVPLFGKILMMTNYVPFRKPTLKNTKLMMEQLVLKSDSCDIS